MERTQYYDNGHFTGEFNENGKRHGHGTYYWKNGDKFEGSWSNNDVSYGTYHYKNGDRYEGSVTVNGKDLLVSGRGKMFYANGTRYVGEVDRGSPHGKGTFYCKNGDYYTGYFKNGNFCGRGKICLVKGDCLEGEFSTNGDEMIVVGHRRFMDGSCQIGTFINNKLEGEGTCRLKDGELIYKGSYKNDKYHGNGTLYKNKYEYYEGEFVDGLKCGKGVWHYGPNYLKCTFRDGSANGKGVLYDFYENTVTEGVWENDELTKTIKEYPIDQNRKTYKIEYTNGDKYVGEAANGKPNGYGKYYRQSYMGEVVYKAYFVNGKISGFGTYTEGDFRYSGEMKKFYPNGIGIKEYKNGASSAEGRFRYGELHGYFTMNNFYSEITFAAGYYNNNDFKGTVYFIYKNGNTYAGKSKDLLPHGKGVYYYPNGSRLIAKFKKGEAHGKAILFEDGAHYSCVYKNGKCIRKTFLDKLSEETNTKG